MMMKRRETYVRCSGECAIMTTWGSTDPEPSISPPVVYWVLHDIRLGFCHRPSHPAQHRPAGRYGIMTVMVGGEKAVEGVEKMGRDIASAVNCLLQVRENTLRKSRRKNMCRDTKVLRCGLICGRRLG